MKKKIIMLLLMVSILPSYSFYNCNYSRNLEKNSQITIEECNSNERSRCIAITKKGKRCKRNAEPGSKYCWQHKK